MKQIILILLFLTASVFANDIDERKTDLYFGNGVWNSYAMAKNGRDKLQERVDANIIKGNQQLKEKYSKVKLVYNWTGTSLDNNIIKKYDAGDVCMDLLDYENNKIDEFLGRAVQQETKDGVVEISLT